MRQENGSHFLYDKASLLYAPVIMWGTLLKTKKLFLHVYVRGRSQTT